MKIDGIFGIVARTRKFVLCHNPLGYATTNSTISYRKRSEAICSRVEPFIFIIVIVYCLKLCRNAGGMEKEFDLIFGTALDSRQGLDLSEVFSDGALICTLRLLNRFHI